MRINIYDITAPLCLNEEGVADIPRAKAVKFTLRPIGHDLIVTGFKTFKYLSNIVEANLHIGTHFDLPSTFGYECDITKLPINYFIREAVIADVREGGNVKTLVKLRDIKEVINESLFTRRPKDERPALIIRTGASKYWCRDNSKYMNFRGISRNLAEYIAHILEPPILGIDAISVDKSLEYRSMSIYPEIDEEFINVVREQEYLPLLNHDILLRKSVYILENLYLEELPDHVNRGLLFAIPLFRLQLPSKGLNRVYAMPCRALIMHPIPSHEAIIRGIEEIEDILNMVLPPIT